MNLISQVKKFFSRSMPGADNDFWYNKIGSSTTAGVRVSEENALKYLTVYACVSLIAADLARLPLILYRRRGEGKERAYNHPLYDILHNAPNEETDSFHWREAGQAHCLLWGNHYSQIERNNAGNVKGLWQIPNPGDVEVTRKNGKIVYVLSDGNGGKVVKNKSDIFHVAGFGFDGLVGKSMITLAREAIGMGLALEQFGSQYFGQGTHPAGVLEFPAILGDKKEAYSKAFKKGFSGLGKSHNVMILDGGSTYKPITIPLDDAQFLETKSHQKIEICGMYHVPPHKIAIHGSNSNYNNLEQENASYVDSCLMSWLVRWESAVSRQLLTTQERNSGLFVEFLVEGLLRGDSAARADFYSKMLAIGAMSPNDVRSKENYDPIDGGNQYFVPCNYYPLDEAGQLTENDSVRTVENRSIEHRAIVARDRISERYLPLLDNVIQTVVNKETKAIKAQVTSRTKRYSEDSFKTWMEKFYNSFGDYVKQKTGPTLRAFLETIRDDSITEMGIDLSDEQKAEVEKFIVDYINGYAERHVLSSKGQLHSLNEEGSPEEIDQRANEWFEKRAGKESRNEKSRVSSAMYQSVAFTVGLGTYWRIRGSETCDFCKMLNGKKVRKGENFADDGSELAPKNNSPMKIRGMKAHPPLHRGCDCYLVTGI